MAGFEEILAQRPNLIGSEAVPGTGYNLDVQLMEESIADRKLRDLQKKKQDKYNLFNPATQSTLLDFASSVQQEDLDVANIRRKQAIDHMAQQGITREDYVRKGLVAQGLEAPMYQDEVDMGQVAMDGRQGLMDNEQTQSILPSLQNLKQFDAGPKHDGTFLESIDAVQAGAYSLAGKGAEFVGSLIRKAGEATNIDYLKREGAQIEKEQIQWRKEGLWNEFAGFNAAKVQQIGIDFAESAEKGDVLGMLDAVATPEAFVALANSTPEMIAMMNPWGLGAVMATNVNKNLNDLGPNATTSEKWVSTGLSIVGTALDRLGDKVILGNGDKALTKLITSMPPPARKAILKKFGGRLTQLGIKATTIVPKAMFEAGTEGVQTILEDKASDVNKLNTNITAKEARSGLEATGIGMAAGGVIPTVQTAKPLIQAAVALKQAGNDRRDINKPSEEIKKGGFSTEADKQKYSDVIQDSLAETEKVETGLNTVEKTIADVQASDASPLDKVSGTQDAMAKVGTISTDSYNTEQISTFGKQEVDKTIDTIFSNSDIQAKLGTPTLAQKMAKAINSITGRTLDEGITKESFTKALNGLSINNKINTITGVLTDLYPAGVPKEIKTAVNSMITDLDNKAAEALSGEKFSVSFDKARNILAHEKKKFNKTADTINKTEINTSPKAYEKLTDLSTDKLNALLSTYDKDTLNALKAKAIKILKDETLSIKEQKDNSGILNSIKLSIRGTKDSRESNAMVKAIKALEKSRAHMKQKYDPKLTVKQKLSKYVTDAKKTLDGLVQTFKTEKAKMEAEAKKSGTKVDTSNLTSTISNTEVVKSAKKAIHNYITNLTNDKVETDPADIPMVQETLQNLYYMGAVTKNQYDKMGKRLGDFIDVEVVEGSEVRDRISNVAAKIIKDVDALIKDNKDVSRNDIKTKIDKLFDRVSSNLSKTEKEMLAGALGTISQKNAEAKAYAEEKLNSLLADNEDKPFADRAKDAFTKGYEATKEALKPENRNKTERNLKAAAKKAGNKFSKTEIAKDSKKLYETIKESVDLQAVKDKGHAIITKMKNVSVDDIHKSTKDFLKMEEDGIELKDGANNTSSNGEVIQGLEENC